MPTLPLRRDNHYVPRSYLKRWANDQGKLWVYRCLTSHDSVPLWTSTSTKGVAYREHLYTRIIASGESNDIERWLDDEFESPAQEAIKRATSGRHLNRRNWKRLIRFFAAQDVRTPARLKQNLQRWKHDFPRVIENTLEEGVRLYEASGGATSGAVAPKIASDEPLPFRVTVEKHKDGKGGVVKGEMIAGRGLWLWGIRHQLSRTLKELEKHQWTILRPPEGMTWFTSDDPVLKVNFNSLTDYTFGGGWGRDGTDLILPLGPHHLMFTQVGRRVPPRNTRMTVEKANIVRRLIAEHAHRFVFAVEPDPFVAEARPRVVNAELFRSEAEEWSHWHEDQTTAERDLMGWESDSSLSG